MLRRPPGFADESTGRHKALSFSGQSDKEDVDKEGVAATMVLTLAIFFGSTLDALSSRRLRGTNPYTRHSLQELPPLREVGGRDALEGSLEGASCLVRSSQA